MKDIDKDTRKIFHDIHIAQTEITSINKRLKSLISTSELKIDKDYFLNKICTDLGCGSGTISEIGQKPKSLDEIEGQYMGLMKFSAEGLKQIKGIFHVAVNNGELLGKDIENSYMTDLLQSVINSGQPITAVPVHGGWVEVDTVDDLFANIIIDRIDRFCKL